MIVPTAVSGAVGWLDRLKRLDRGDLRVDFGRPFRFNTSGRSRIPRGELTLMTQEAMYQLALALPYTSLRGEYRDVERATTQTLTFIDPTSQDF